MTHVLRSRTVSGLAINEALYPPYLKQPRHTHALASFSFVLTGAYVENYDGQAQTRTSSTIVFHPPQESHAVEFQSKPVRILSVHINSNRFSFLQQSAVGFDSRSCRRTATIGWLGRRLHQEFRRADSASVLALEGLVLEILAEASRANSISEKASPRWLQQATDFLHDNFTDSFTFDDVARNVGVHPVHLARVFREKNGCTIGEYLRRLRLEFAARKIATSDTLLSEIASAAGFADQSHLTKTFKIFFGLTPSEYRRLHQR